MSTLNNNPKERIFAFDAAKAIGIFFIVIGHVFHDQGIYAQYVYSFHVPLFFFLTGVTFSRGKNGFWKFLIQKLTRLLVPFYIFAAVSWGAYAILGKFVSSFAEKAIDSSVPAIIIGILKGYCAVNTPLWFLPCLFLELLFLYAITFIIDRIASKRRLSYALFGVSIIAAIVIQYVIYKFSLFPTKAPIFKADVAIAMLPFSLKICSTKSKNLAQAIHIYFIIVMRRRRRIFGTEAEHSRRISEQRIRQNTDILFIRFHVRTRIHPAVFLHPEA